MLASMFVCKLMKVFKLSDTGCFRKQFPCRLGEVFLSPWVLAFFNIFFSKPKGIILVSWKQKNCTCLKIKTISSKAWVCPDIVDLPEGSEKP